MQSTTSDRRSFLRGVLLTGTAAAITPTLVADGVVSAASGVALLSPPSGTDPEVPQHMVDAIIPNLRRRIEAQRSITGATPQVMFVNRFEFRAVYLALMPLLRFHSKKFSDRGIPNLMVLGVPIVCVDQDTMAVTPEGALA